MGVIGVKYVYICAHVELYTYMGEIVVLGDFELWKQGTAPGISLRAGNGKNQSFEKISI